MLICAEGPHVDEYKNVTMGHNLLSGIQPMDQCFLLLEVSLQMTIELVADKVMGKPLCSRQCLRASACINPAASFPLDTGFDSVESQLVTINTDTVSGSSLPPLLWPLVTADVHMRKLICVLHRHYSIKTETFQDAIRCVSNNALTL